MRETILIVGATSSLAQALCRALAGRGHPLVLAGRDKEELDVLAFDLNIRYGAVCTTLAADFLNLDLVVRAFIERAGGFKTLIMAAGDMGSGDIKSLADIAFTIHLNYTLPAQICAAAAESLATRGGGRIAVISSIAGDRGRAKIAAYGSAKAALSSFASALRQAYAGQGVHVMTVKPGYVDTPMTWGMASPLMASRETVAGKIIAALDKKKDVVYVPWFWKYIMLIIRHIPERMFKRLTF